VLVRSVDERGFIFLIGNDWSVHEYGPKGKLFWKASFLPMDAIVAGKWERPRDIEVYACLMYRDYILIGIHQRFKEEVGNELRVPRHGSIMVFDTLKRETVQVMKTEGYPSKLMIMNERLHSILCGTS
jgi:hypothetical protein